MAPKNLFSHSAGRPLGKPAKRLVNLKQAKLLLRGYMLELLKDRKIDEFRSFGNGGPQKLLKMLNTLRLGPADLISKDMLSVAELLALGGFKKPHFEAAGIKPHNLVGVRGAEQMMLVAGYSPEEIARAKNAFRSRRHRRGGN